MTLTPYQKIKRAADAGRGVKLSATECWQLMQDDAIAQVAEADELAAGVKPTDGVKAGDPVPSLESAVRLPLHQAAQWNTAVACAEREPHKPVALEGRTVFAVHAVLTAGVGAVHAPDGYLNTSLRLGVAISPAQYAAMAPEHRAGYRPFVFAAGVLGTLNEQPKEN
jgi:hypothetical protein